MKNIGCVTAIGLLALVALTATNARAQEERLIMGVFPGVEQGQAEAFEILDRFGPLAAYLTSKAATKVLVLPVKVPSRAMQQMVENRSIYKLFFGPPVFASEAIHKAGFVPVVVERERIRAVFVVRADSLLQNLGGLAASTRVAMPTPKLLLAILGNETLAQAKIALKPEARVHIASSDGIFVALDNGIADVAVMRDRVVRKLMADNPSKYRIVGQTVDAPGFALIAHKSVPARMRDKLRQAALALNDDASPLAAEARANLRTSPFVAGKDDEFDALQRMMAAWAQ
jgi:ABC-type phosphate/phosphonate transport system substrate-binding protein